MPNSDRQRGALIGLDVGDALGAAVEFKRPGTFEPVTGYRSGGPHGLETGEWTDDTSMALALADSIAEMGWDINDQAQRYVQWWQHGAYSVNGHCFDIGNTTAAALHRFQRSGDATTSGDASERASGNGSIMRLAPVSIRFASLFPDDIEGLAKPQLQLAQDVDTPPTTSSYWVIPGRLLAGAYPGNLDPEKHRQKLRVFLVAGVRTFINLMQPDEVDHQGTPFLSYEDDVKRYVPEASCLRISIRDLGIPSTSGMTTILDAIDESLAADRCVYVHCWGGVGRTGTVIGCCLLRHGLATT